MKPYYFFFKAEELEVEEPTNEELELIEREELQDYGLRFDEEYPFFIEDESLFPYESDT